MEHSTDLLEEHSVQAFSDAIVLGCIMHGEFLLRSSLSKVFLELVAGVLSSTIREELLDSYIVLGFTLVLVLYVRLEGFVFVTHQLYFGPTLVTVDKRCGVFAGTN